MTPTTPRRGFTIVELGVTIAVATVIASIAAVTTSQPGDQPAKPAAQPEKDKPKEDPGMIGALAKARSSARQIKDSTQIRGIHQGLVIFAQNNQDNFPFPSLLDKKDTTLACPADEKNTTANIMSVLMYNGFFGPEITVSPAETNKNIKVMTTYSYNEPKGAVNPKLALWDTAYSVDFTDGKTGNLSYAHLMPSATKMKEWSNTFNALSPVVGNRAPRIDALQTINNELQPVLPASSNTYGIHGDPKRWEGNIAFNDNHVDFMTTMSEMLTYKDREGVKVIDNYFYNEPDDADDSNCTMGLYIRSGKSTKFFQGIWD